MKTNKTLKRFGFITTKFPLPPLFVMKNVSTTIFMFFIFCATTVSASELSNIEILENELRGSYGFKL